MALSYNIYMVYIYTYIRFTIYNILNYNILNYIRIMLNKLNILKKINIKKINICNKVPDPLKVRHTLECIAEGTYYLNLYSHIHV